MNVIYNTTYCSIQIFNVPSTLLLETVQLCLIYKKSTAQKYKYL